jgi:hypothetical protein
MMLSAVFKVGSGFCGVGVNSGVAVAGVCYGRHHPGEVFLAFVFLLFIN